MFPALVAIVAFAGSAFAGDPLHDPVGLMCFVAQNAGFSPDSICSKYGFTHAPSVTMYTETRAPANTTAGDLCSGCLEFVNTNGDCPSGSTICEIMADQASAKGVLPYQAAFLRAASTWKVGTDGFSGAEHNCNAYGFCGAVSHSFLLSANEKQALQRAAGLAASTCPADACEDEAALCDACSTVVKALASGTSANCSSQDVICGAFSTALQPIAGAVSGLLSQYRTTFTSNSVSNDTLASLVCGDIGGVCGLSWGVGIGGAGSGVATNGYGAIVRGYAQRFDGAMATLSAASGKNATAAASLRAQLLGDFAARARTIAQAGTQLTFGGATLSDKNSLAALVDAAGVIADAGESSLSALSDLLRKLAATVRAGKLGADLATIVSAAQAAVPPSQAVPVADVLALAFDDFVLKERADPPTAPLPSLLHALVTAAPVSFLSQS